MAAVDELETVKISTESLRTHHRNPRRGNLDAIKESLTRNGQYRAITVNKGTFTGRPYEVLAGNHTLMAARQLGWDTITAHLVDVDEDQATRIVVADNRTSDLAETDDAALITLLEDLDGDLDGTGYTPDDLEELANEEELPDVDGEANLYTGKVATPVYEPTGRHVDVRELADTGKTDALLEEIDAADIPEELRKFLRYAAYRHTVIDYRLVAEFYCEQPPEVQELFEKQALVIIDMDAAIEGGYVKMTSRLQALLDDELTGGAADE